MQRRAFHHELVLGARRVRALGFDLDVVPFLEGGDSVDDDIAEHEGETRLRAHFSILLIMPAACGAFESASRELSVALRAEILTGGYRLAVFELHAPEIPTAQRAPVFPERSRGPTHRAHVLDVVGGQPQCLIAQGHRMLHQLDFDVVSGPVNAALAENRLHLGVVTDVRLIGQKVTLHFFVGSISVFLCPPEVAGFHVAPAALALVRKAARACLLQGPVTVGATDPLQSHAGKPDLLTEKLGEHQVLVSGLEPVRRYLEDIHNVAALERLPAFDVEVIGDHAFVAGAKFKCHYGCPNS